MEFEDSGIQYKRENAHWNTGSLANCEACTLILVKHIDPIYKNIIGHYDYGNHQPRARLCLTSRPQWQWGQPIYTRFRVFACSLFRRLQGICQYVGVNYESDAIFE